MSEDKENKDTKITLDKDLFWSRLEKYYESWSKGPKVWGGDVDALVLVYGEEDDDVLYSRAIAVQLSLFGYELSDTSMVFAEDTLHILTGAKKAKILEILGTQSPSSDLKLNIIPKKKGEMSAQFEELVDVIQGSKNGKKIGIVAKNKTKGSFASKFNAALKDAGFEQVDVSIGYSQVLALKDAAAKRCIKQAAHVSSTVLRKYLLNQLLEIVDEEKAITHSKLADDTEEVFSNPNKVKLKLRPDNLESCYTPIIMSGGSYDLKPSAESNEENLHYGTIVCALGGRYKNYCSNIARTYFINPTKDQEEVYELLTQAYQACKTALKPGNKLLDVYNAAVAVVKRRKADLVDKFTANCGCAIGLEFRETSLLLSAKNTRVIKTGMVFNLCIGFSDVETTDAEKKKNPKTATYSVMLADTILVTEDEPEMLTHCPRAYGDVSYFIDEGGEGDGESSDEEERIRGMTKGNLRQGVDEKVNDLAANQKALAKKKTEEALKRLAEKDIGNDFKTSDSDIKILSYASKDDYPDRAKPHHIFVDAANESVLLPIEDQLVPFHIATIKNVHKNDEGDSAVLNVSFLVPNEPGAQKIPNVADAKKFFIRELTFKSSSASLSKAYFDLKELRKRYLNRLKEHEEKKTLVVQEALVVNKRTGPIAKLRDVSIRPNLARKRVTGIVVAHENGLRYTSADKVKLDIIYKNIRQAFFLPAENSAHVLLHFELHNGIIIDKKKASKTNYVQFYVEVIDQSQDLSSRSRYQDEDGLLEEQQERRQRQRWNERFHSFVKKVEDALAKSADQPKLEFDIPYRELAFTGVANRASVDIMPTVHSLVALDDQPPMVMSLDDVEIANFERVQFQLRNFDLAFVFKDFTRPVLRLTAIPMKSLEPIRNWLNSCSIVYYETQQNMLWKNVMKTIAKDPKQFYEDGGWNFLRAEGSSDEEAEEEDDSDEFQPDSEEEESDDDEYDSGSEVEESEESDYVEDSEDEGEDWEELERKAQRADREQGVKERMEEKDMRRREEAKMMGKGKPVKKKQRK